MKPQLPYILEIPCVVAKLVVLDIFPVIDDVHKQPFGVPGEIIASVKNPDMLIAHACHS